MNKGISISDLARKIDANVSLKQDFIADTSKTTMQIQADRTPVLELPEAHGSFPLLPVAHDQIAARLNIPAKYYDRMRASAPDLLALNVNTWFRQNPEKRMIRTLGGDVRAFLSNRYNRIENEEIAQVVGCFSLLGETGPLFRHVAYGVPEDKMSLHRGILGQVAVG